jgi:hypothetical protein
MENDTIQSEIISLPSKGKLYPIEHPLSKGTIRIKYPTAKEEDILMSQNLVQKGLVIDEFLKSLILTEGVNLDDIMIGDENAVMYAARILAYGNKYEIEIACPSCYKKQNVEIDLNKIDEKDVDISKIEQGVNSFNFELPLSKKVVTFKFLSHGDENNVQLEAKKLSKFDKSSDHQLTTRLKKTIIAIEGDTSQVKINKFVDSMLLRDSVELKRYILKIMPDINAKFNFECEECDYTQEVPIPLGVTFLWPDAQL